MAAHIETIYVALTGQAAGTLRPVIAARRAGDLFEILSRNDDPEDEAWEFPSGSLVRCERKELHGVPALVAVRLQPPWAPRAVPDPFSEPPVTSEEQGHVYKPPT
jgi:hypothetical protein